MVNRMKLGLGLVAAVAIATAAHGAGAQEGSKMTLKRFTFAHGVDAREPQDATTTFKTSDDRVYAFVEVDNPGKTEGQIEVVFQPPTGAALAPIPLTVGALPRFRTWAFTRKAHEAGEWTVTIRDEGGRMLGRESFTMK
jgi:Protein of unknown function (DUF2914)